MLVALSLTSAFAVPAFDAPHGVVDAPFSLTIGGDGGALYYSLDGSVPSVPYAGPIPISATTVVRAVEVGAETSAVVTSTYVFPADVLASGVMDQAYLSDASLRAEADESLRTLPTISLVAPAGISMTEGPVSLEWIDPTGADATADCGAYVSGGTSWQYEKTSFRLVFRSSYGPGRLKADLYGDHPVGLDPVTSFDALSLRGGNHDTVFYLGAQGQHLRNFWMDETQLEQGHVAPHGRFAHVYLNGAYHGLYHVRERWGAAMLADYLGGEEEDYEAVNGGTPYDGSGAGWSALVAASDNWAEARRWLDVDDYLDYMVLNYYAANAWDWWSWHNWDAAGPSSIDAGGFRFHSSDSDICLYYDWSTNILYLGGPSDVFLGLMAEGDPDFRVALADAIHRNLTGPLSAEAAGDRYARLARQAEGGLVLESARWGYGWWDRDGEWATERDRLLNGWFPFRTDEMLRQFREAGWYPLDAPVLDTEAGLVPPGTTIMVSAPDDSAAELWVSLDGDPRLSGGMIADGALGPDGARSLTLDRSVVVTARLRDGDVWGPMVQAFYEVDAPPPIVLNEWNAVDEDSVLKEGSDPAFGQVPGNGGDWIELLVTEDVDLSGWRLRMDDRAVSSELVFGDVPTLRAGTILTIAEDLPEDTSYDPERGDWRVHLRTDGAWVSGTFDVSSADWHLSALDADGAVRFGPAGEGIGDVHGVGRDEVGALQETPDADFRRATGKWKGTGASTFGAPNTWDDGAQDLDLLRGVSPVQPRAHDPVPQGCGCASTGVGPFPWLLLVLVRRRR